MFLSSRAVHHAPAICSSCRLRAVIGAKQLARSRRGSSLRWNPPPQASESWRFASTTKTLRQEQHKVTNAQGVSVVVKEAAATLSPEEAALAARQEYGDALPDDVLDTAAYQVYERLYGTPLRRSEQEHEEVLLEEETEDAVEYQGTGLLRETADGELEEVLIETDGHVEEIDEFEVEAAEETQEDELDVNGRLARDIESSTRTTSDEQFEEAEDTDADPFLRAHPLTVFNRFGTFPATLPLPKNTMTEPIEQHLSSVNNTHLSEAAHRVFGGIGLPYSTSTPSIARTTRTQQKAIPLTAAQNSMSPMEGDVFVSVLYPGIYAAVMSVLVETRKRLGTAWAEGLVRRAERGELRVLDAGGGGAGILAVREMIRAEWDRMHEESAEGQSEMSIAEVDGKVGGMGIAPPLGLATVLTGSDILRQRAAKLLENTTFVPRLPDYIHAETAKEGGKFDLVIAPHTLWPLREDYIRKMHVENLWSLLKRDEVEEGEGGGVLLLLEKGIPRGFELVAGAREMLLETRISPPSFLFADKDVDVEWEDTPTTSEQHRPEEQMQKDKGMIVAPCTNHKSCPMYVPKGQVKGRRDICHFSQRYVRPPSLQRILGAKDRNFEDVKFAYLSVMRGKGLPEPQAQTEVLGDDMIQQGEISTVRAFEGYEHIEDPTTIPSHTLPRAVLPPLKRRGHVILDLCTPSGTLERWTVPRSFSKQAFKDARKSSWGDLWALGAKTRVPRTPKIKKREVEFDLEGTLVKSESVMDYDEYGRVVVTEKRAAGRMSGREKKEKQKRKKRERRMDGEVD